MILDALLRFSNNQSLISGAATVPSTDEVDFGLGTAANPQIPTPAQGGGVRDMGVGDNPALKFVVQIGIAALGTTMQVLIQGAPDNGSGAPGAYVTWWASPVYAAATMTAGARLLDMDMPRPPAGVPVPRFVRLAYVIGGTMTAGSVSAYLVIDRDDQMYNAANNAIQGGYRPGIAVAN